MVSAAETPTGNRVIADRYQLLAEVGRGGMGVVWRAQDRLIGRPVAVKELVRVPGSADPQGEAAQRMLREVRATGRLNHRAAVTVYDAVWQDGCAHIVMEFVDAPSLTQLVNRSGPMPPRQVAAMGLEVLGALRQAHDAGIVHRDVKPANVMVTARGEVKILDFGVATSAGGEAFAEARAVGTLAYMSPEQTRGEAADARADVWSVGALLHELTTGRRAFRAADDRALVRAIQQDALDAEATVDGGVPPAIAAIVRRCLEKEPARRYQRMCDLLVDLRAVRAGDGGRLAWRRARWLVGLTLAVALPITGWWASSARYAAAHRGGTAHAVDAEAYALYLKGARYADDPRRAMLFYEAAVAKEPRFALAQARLAVSHVMVTHDRSAAERAIARALAVDPSLSEAYDALGLLRMWLDHDWPAAESALRRSIALNAHNARAHHELGQLLMRTGRCDLAVVEEQGAVLDNPGVALYQSGLAEVYLYCRRYDDAVRELGQTLGLVRDSANVFYLLGDAYFYQRRYPEALAMYARTSRPPPGWAYVPLGRRDEALRAARAIEARLAGSEVPPRLRWDAARLYTTLGDRERALRWLERADDAHDGMLVYLGACPHFDALRDEPRFRALLAKVRLDRYPVRGGVRQR
jgi:tetratricopeptide (TPR) repeat protein